ncbi:hypothetical protein EMIT043CA1_30293 [Pseudomonas brassicacearum]
MARNNQQLKCSQAIRHCVLYSHFLADLIFMSWDWIALNVVFSIANVRDRDTP